MIRIGFIAIIFIVHLSCENKYAKGVQKDTQTMIRSQKYFVKSISFDGEVSEKKFCDKCEFNKYQIIVQLKEMDPKTIPLSNQSFQPFYFFQSTDKLTLSVTQELYESVTSGTLIKKEKESNFLIINEKKYRLLSEKELEWMP